MKKNKKNTLIIIIIVLVIILALSLIGVGVYFNNLAKPKNIAGKTIDKANYLVTNYIDRTYDYKIGDNFSLESDIKFNINSEYYNKLKKTDIDALKKVNYMNNLSNLQTLITVKQDRNNKRAFVSISEQLPKENIVDYKLVIDNSTEYYLMDKITSNYINNGSCNYFESFGKDGTTRSNMEYVYDFSIKSLKNNLKEEYFTEEYITEKINGEDKEVKKVSLRLTDRTIREILSNIDKDFSKRKVGSKKDILGNTESYTINFYTSKLVSNLLKMEIVYMNGTDKNTLTYIGDNSKAQIYYIEGDQLIYDIDAIYGKNQYELKIKNAGGSEIGNAKLEFEKKRVNFVYSLKKDDNSTDIVYSSKTDGDIKRGSTKDTTITFKIFEGLVSKYDGEVNILSKVSKDVTIDEDIASSILASTLTDKQNEYINGKKDAVKARFER